MFHIALSSVYDIAKRTIPFYLMITAVIISIVGFVLQIVNSISIWYTILPIAVYLIITAINAHQIKKNKPILFGGADNIVLLAICAVMPVMFGIVPSLILVPAGAIVISTLTRMIPKVNREFQSKGVPFIPFMGIVYLVGMVIG